MQLLTLRVPTASHAGMAWRDRRLLAMTPTPDVPGLRARWWRAGRRRVVGRYLFDDGGDPEALAGDVARWDPAVAPLLAHRAVEHRLDPVAADDPHGVLDRPVFLVSAPRSGSTMLHQLLVRSRALWSIPGGMQDLVDGIPSLALPARGFDSQVLDERDAVAATADTLRAAMLAERGGRAGMPGLDEPSGPPTTGPCLIETLPENALRIPFLDRVFPGARFVFLHRDLRQAVSSLVEAWQRDGFVSIPDLPGWRRGDWCFLLPAGWRRYGDASLTTLAAFQWGEANRAILHALDALARDRWTTVGYTDLVADPVAQLRRLHDFIGVDPPAEGPAGRRDLAMSSSTVTPPSPIKWRSNAAFDPGAVAGLQPLAGRIRALGALSNPPVARESSPTTIRFAVFVDTLEPAPVPADAIVAPSLRAQPGTTLPLGLLRKVGHRERFVGEHPMVWVRDEGVDIWTPLWLRRHQAWLTQWLRPGAPPPGGLTGRLLEQCRRAGILVTPDELGQRRSYAQDVLAPAKVALRDDRYCLLPRLLDPVLTGGVAAYYRRLLDSGDWPLGDAQVGRRHGWHNERLAQFLHHQLTGVASLVAGRPLKPSYCFSSAYRGGAVLDAHVDREQCDYTLSLTIDQTSQVHDEPWVLWFQAPTGRRQVTMAVSDGVLFRGNELPHWRDPGAADHEQVNLLFHFVPSDWAGVLD